MAKHGVLVVEDEELMRSILRRLLEDEDYDVFTADSAESALAVYPENDIAVTLTDIKMSGMDGIELLDRLKAIDEEAVVIIMPAYSSVDSAVAALRKGAYDYVTKPFVNEDLLQTVKNAIQERTALITRKPEVMYSQARAPIERPNRPAIKKPRSGRKTMAWYIFGSVNPSSC